MPTADWTDWTSTGVWRTTTSNLTYDSSFFDKLLRYYITKEEEKVKTKQPKPKLGEQLLLFD